MNINPIKFGDLRITTDLQTNRSEAVIFSLDDKDFFDKKGHQKGTVWINHIPIGVSEKVGKLSRKFAEGNEPTEDEFRTVVHALISNKDELNRSEERYKLQHLLNYPLKEKAGQPIIEYWNEIKETLEKALKTHVFKANIDGLLSSVFGNKVMLVPEDTANADEITLAMIEMGCIKRK